MCPKYLSKNLICLFFLIKKKIFKNSFLMLVLNEGNENFDCHLHVLLISALKETKRSKHLCPIPPPLHNTSLPQEEPSSHACRDLATGCSPNTSPSQSEQPQIRGPSCLEG